MNIPEHIAEHFRVETRPLFLSLNIEPDIDEQAIGLVVKTAQTEGNWERVIKELMSPPMKDVELRMPFAVRTCMTEVARTSRRGAANMVFASLDLIDEIFGRWHEQFDNIDVTFVPMPLEKNTIITAYSKITQLVDGPFAVFEDRLYLNDHWQRYFCKAVLRNIE